jgi:hypothetical protein
VAQYIRKPGVVQVWHSGDPLPADWPEWTLRKVYHDEPDPLWIVKGAKGFLHYYFDDGAFFRDYEKAEAA